MCAYVYLHACMEVFMCIKKEIIWENLQYIYFKRKQTIKIYPVIYILYKLFKNIKHCKTKPRRKKDILKLVFFINLDKQSS